MTAFRAAAGIGALGLARAAELKQVRKEENRCIGEVFHKEFRRDRQQGVEGHIRDLQGEWYDNAASSSI